MKLRAAVDEMTTLRRLGTELHAADDPLPESLRRRILHAERPPERRQRGAWRIGLAGALALALTAIAYAIMADKAGHTPGPAQSRHTTAIAVLHNAALVAQEVPPSTPAGSQFVFTEMLTNYSSQLANADGSVTTVPGTLALRHIWLSVDGSKAGLIVTRPYKAPRSNSERLVVPACTPSTGGEGRCRPQPGFNADIPTETSQMLAWLRGTANRVFPLPQRSPGANADPLDDLAFQTAGEVLGGGTFLTPQQRAAMFNGIAELPGAIRVTGNVRDLTGRDGVGIGLADSAPLIFDTHTHAFLGTKASTILRQVVVNSAGQLP